MNDLAPEAPIAAPIAPLSLFLTCPKGIEGLLAEEMAALGASTYKEGLGGVHASGDLRFALKACLYSRLAARVLLPLVRFPMESVESIYQAAHDYPWPDLFEVHRTFAIEVAGTSKIATHTQYAGLKAKDGVVDKFRAQLGRRPDIDAVTPDIRLHLHISDREGQLSLDLSGEALHRRGYRLAQGTAPLKENLAAALLMRAGWPAMAAKGAALFDPFCGSGTLVIEAAWMAAGIAPGHLRERWGFSAWNGHDHGLWAELLGTALEHKHTGLKTLPPLFGHDISAQAIAVARGNGQRAGLTGRVDFQTGNATTLSRPVAGAGLLICNPPYGERMSEEAELITMHTALGVQVKAELADWRFALFTSRPDFGFRLGLRADKMYNFHNGALPCKLLVMDVHGQRMVRVAEALVAEEGSPAAEAPRLVEVEVPRHDPLHGDELANRLRKNFKHLAKWARRNGVNNYRVYDADLPHYALAIDLYNTPELHAVVQEYAPPSTIPVPTAEKRLRQGLQVIQDVLELPPGHLHYKLRKAQKGANLYQRLYVQDSYHAAIEGNAKLWVNFDDYLDTGLFLDHRPLRERIQREAAGKRMLNLFCYTGSATVHAAIGGAKQTTSVDMSNTYLDWLHQNLELNDCTGREVEGRAPLPAQLPKHALVRADCVKWLAQQAEAGDHEFDLIFCDPPTFSNSKKMDDTWDVQRDHLQLLTDTIALLAPAGVLYFSCNRQRFKLDIAGLEALGMAVEDITRHTLDEDFKRPPAPHRAWKIMRA